MTGKCLPTGSPASIRSRTPATPRPADGAGAGTRRLALRQRQRQGPDLEGHLPRRPRRVRRGATGGDGRTQGAAGAHPRSPTSRRTSSAARSSPPARKLYQTYCVACHQGDGKGDGARFPPLAATRWVSGNQAAADLGRAARPAAARSTSRARRYNGVMPANGFLTDDQVAQLLTYLRQNFGNHAEGSTRRAPAVRARPPKCQPRASGRCGGSAASHRDGRGARRSEARAIWEYSTEQATLKRGGALQCSDFPQAARRCLRRPALSYLGCDVRQAVRKTGTDRGRRTGRSSPRSPPPCPRSLRPSRAVVAGFNRSGRADGRARPVVSCAQPADTRPDAGVLSGGACSGRGTCWTRRT